MFRRLPFPLLAVVLTMALAQPLGALPRVGREEIQKLLDAIDQSDRVEVFEVNLLQAGKRLYASGAQSDLAALKDSIRIVPQDEGFMCMCDPSILIRLYQNGKKTGELGIIGGDIIRYLGWKSDARIADVKPWFAWLDDRGIHEPRKQFEEEQAEEERERIAEDRWMKAMPASIAPLWADAVRSLLPGMNAFVPKETAGATPGQDARVGSSKSPALDAALAREYPEKRERILKLFAWYGNGAGPWSGFPAYESMAEQMLLEYSTPELVGAVRDAPLNEEQIEGAARLFAGWQFNQDRPKDNALLPAALKRVLLEHSLASTDQDKRGRARRWLSGAAPRKR